MTERLAALLQRRARLDEAIAAARRAESEASRKADARRKIVVGATLLSAARRDPNVRAWLRGFLDQALSERDRALLADGDEAARDLVLALAPAIVPGPTEALQEGGWVERGLAG